MLADVHRKLPARRVAAFLVDHGLDGHHQKLANHDLLRVIERERAKTFSPHILSCCYDGAHTKIKEGETLPTTIWQAKRNANEDGERLCRFLSGNRKPHKNTDAEMRLKKQYYNYIKR